MALGDPELRVDAIRRKGHKPNWPQLTEVIPQPVAKALILAEFALSPIAVLLVTARAPQA